jgi:uncharacterized protein (TIGR00297 family)
MIDNFMISGSSNSINGFIDAFIIKLPFFYLYIIAAMVIISIIAYKFKLLSGSGSVAAFTLGTIVVFAFGTGGLLVYMFFMILAAVLAKINENNEVYKEAEEIQEKGNTRDWVQVFSNGGLVMILAIAYLINPNPIILLMFGGSICEAVCDTSAGEIGMLFKGLTVSIITGKPQKSGLSGGISFEGTLGGFIASLITAMIWYSCYFYPSFSTISYMMVAAVTGFAGCLIDSVMGATIQAHYFDEKNNKLTEKEYIDNKRLPLVRGVRFFDNDKVNLMSNLFSIIFAMLLGVLVL